MAEKCQIKKIVNHFKKAVYELSRIAKKKKTCLRGFLPGPTQPELPEEMARSLNFRIWEVHGLSM